jgi:starch-binding outer membrane protein, SusD/RagB family
VIQGGPELSDTQLLDTAVAGFTKAVSTATAAGAAGTDIVNESNVGLARTYLQLGDFTNAAATAALVPSDFVVNVVTTGNVSTQGTLGNLIYGTTVEGQAVAPERYRVGDPRMPIDSIAQAVATLNGLPSIIQTKFTSYADPIRLASGLEAQYIVAEATLQGGGGTAAALSLINTRRTAGGQGAYGGPTDNVSVLQELLNQRARDFWMEGKKLGDLRRNPSVSLPSVLTDPVGAPFYTSVGGGTFGDTFCAPIPPEETNANPNF